MQRADVPVISLRCYACATRERSDAAQCRRCGANFRAICPCGAEFSVFDEACTTCGAPHPPKRLPRSKLPAVRAAKWTALTVALAATGWIVWGPRPTPPWRVKEAALDSFTRGDFEAAARSYRVVTEQRPEDAAAWYMLALAYRRLGHDRTVYVPLADKAVLLAPDLHAARRFLVRCALEVGDLERALEHAEASARAPGAPGDAHQMRAEVELARPAPNLALVQDELEKARAGGVESPEARILLAEVCLRLYGALAGDAARVYPGVSARLREALPALDAAAIGSDDPSATSLAKARIHLALGEAEAAFTDADAALARLDADAPATTRAELRLTRGLALYARGNKVEGIADLAAAIRARPDGAMAGSACGYLVGSGDSDTARALLVQCAQAADPTGAVHAVLANLLASRGEYELASDAIAAARAAAPTDAALASIEGSIRAARGNLDAARAAYSEAVRLAPRSASPRVELAMLALAPRNGAGPAAGDLSRALEEIETVRSQFGEDAQILTASGRVRLAQGDTAGARAVLEHAAQLAPYSPEVWCLLAEARRRSTDADALELAAQAYGRARLMRPRDRGVVLAEVELRLAAGSSTEAATACTEYLRLVPGDPEILARRAQAYRSLRMWNNAAEDLRRVRSVRGGDDVAVVLADSLYRAGNADEARRVALEVLPSASPDARCLLEVMDAVNRRSAKEALEKLRGAAPSVLTAELLLMLADRDAALVTLRSVWAAQPGDPAAARLLVFTLLDRPAPRSEDLAAARSYAGELSPGAPQGLGDLLAGRILLAAGDAAAAAAPLRVAARSLPTDPLAAIVLGEALFRTGERKDSLVEFRRAVTLPGAPSGAAVVAASRLLAAAAESKDAVAAERLAQESLRIDPSCADAAEALASILSARGAFRDAAEVAERAAETSSIPKERRDRLGLRAAAARCSAGDFDKAHALLGRVGDADRTSALGRTLRGYASLGAKRLDEAETEFLAALAAEPGLAAAQLGRIDVELRRNEEKRAVAIVAEWLAAHAADETFAVQAARRLAASGRPAAAERVLRDFLAAHADAGSAASEFATLLIDSGRPAEAVAAYAATAAQSSPQKRTQAEIQLARLKMFDPARRAEALADARRLAVSSSATEIQIRSARAVEAESLLRMGRVAEAEVVAEDVAKAWSPSGEASPEERMTEAAIRFVLGTSAAPEPRRRARALEQLARAHELAPEDHGITNNLAWLLGQRSETAARGLELAERATTDAPAFADYWDTRAICAAAAGQPEEAEKSWKRSLEIGESAERPVAVERGRTELRYAAFLRGSKRENEARTRAAAVVRYASGTEAEIEAREFLAQ